MTPLVQPSNQPGQMTAVMRALRPTAGPRVLRVAWVSRGRLIEERILDRGASLTVGPNEKSTFILNEPIAARTLRLIEWTGRGYVLNVIKGMGGRIAAETGVVDLASQEPSADGVRQIRLGEGARGKIVLGGALLLFQFTDAPIAPAKPQLPITVKQGLMDNLDWKTTFIAAFSFLFHFGAIGSIYSDWTDSIVDDDVTVTQTIEMIHDLPKPAIEMHDEAKPTASADASASPAPNPGPKVVSPGPGKPGPNGNPGADPGHTTDVTATRIAGQLREMDALMQIGLNGPGAGRATDAVLRNGDLPMGVIDGMARSDRGVGPGDPADLHLSGGGGTIRPGETRPGGLPGGVVASTVDTGAGRILEPKKPPTTTTTIGGTTVGGGGSIANAAAVIASLRGGFRACYKRGLDEDPTMRGRVQLTAKIGPNGEVTSAQASGSGLSSTVTSCLAGKLKSAQFDPPSNGGATLIVPIIFEVQ